MSSREVILLLKNQFRDAISNAASYARRRRQEGAHESYIQEGEGILVGLRRAKCLLDAVADSFGDEENTEVDTPSEKPSTEGDRVWGPGPMKKAELDPAHYTQVLRYSEEEELKDLRDDFAASALAGLLASKWNCYTGSNAAVEAYRVADAMLKVRNK